MLRFQCHFDVFISNAIWCDLDADFDLFTIHTLSCMILSFFSLINSLEFIKCSRQNTLHLLTNKYIRQKIWYIHLRSNEMFRNVLFVSISSVKHTWAVCVCVCAIWSIEMVLVFFFLILMCNNAADKKVCNIWKVSDNIEMGMLDCVCVACAVWSISITSKCDRQPNHHKKEHQKK